MNDPPRWSHITLSKYTSFENDVGKWVAYKPKGDLTLTVHDTQSRTQFTVSDGSNTLARVQFPRKTPHYVCVEKPWIGIKLTRHNRSGRRFQIKVQQNDDMVKVVAALKRAGAKVDCKDDSEVSEQAIENIPNSQPQESQSVLTSQIPMTQYELGSYESDDSDDNEGDIQVMASQPMERESSANNTHDQLTASQPTMVTLPTRPVRFATNGLQSPATTQNTQHIIPPDSTFTQPRAQSQSSPRKRAYTQCQALPRLEYVSASQPVQQAVGDPHSQVPDAPSLRPVSPLNAPGPAYPLISDTVPRLATEDLRKQIHKVVKDKSFWDFIDQVDSVWNDVSRGL